MAFDATAGGQNANSYCDVEFADDYFETRWGAATTWSDTSDDDKEILLITATARLEEQTYKGSRSTDTQALKWPRDGLTVDGVDIDSETVPTAVKKACCEAAIALLEDQDVFESGGDLEGFSSIQIGNDRFDLRQGGNRSLPTNVLRFLGPFLNTRVEVIRN